MIIWDVEQMDAIKRKIQALDQMMAVGEIMAEEAENVNKTL